MVTLYLHCMKFWESIFVVMVLAVLSWQASAQQVHHIGSLRSLHREGRTEATVLLDTLPQQHLYAIGPVEGLQGEIYVWDGKPFVAGWLKESGQPYVKKDVHPLRAVFLVYAQVPAWDTIPLNTHPSDLRQLERVIAREASRHGMDTTQAFPFLLYGKVQKGRGHVLQADSVAATVTPEARQDATFAFGFENVKSQLIGFYSQHHQGVFTHHDSFLHIHFRLNTKYQAGHLEEVAFDPAAPLWLYLPAGKH